MPDFSLRKVTAWPASQKPPFWLTPPPGPADMKAPRGPACPETGIFWQAMLRSTYTPPLAESPTTYCPAGQVSVRVCLPPVPPQRPAEEALPSIGNAAAASHTSPRQRIRRAKRALLRVADVGEYV